MVLLIERGRGGGGERTRSRGEWCVDGIANRERKGGGEGPGVGESGV